MKRTTADLKFTELRRFRLRNGKTKIVIKRRDGITECLWPDELESRRINQKLRRDDLAARRAARLKSPTSNLKSPKP